MPGENLSDDTIVNLLDISYVNSESLKEAISKYLSDKDEITRNRLILESDFGKDEEIRSTILLFGAKDEQ